MTDGRADQDTAPCGFVLRSPDGQWLEMRIERRQVPQATDFWDGNWLLSRIHGEFGYGISARLDHATLRSDDLNAFDDQLRALLTGATTSAQLSSMEHWLDLVVLADDGDTFTVTGTVSTEAAGNQTRLTFLFEAITSTALHQLSERLRAINRRYPVLDRPTET